MILYEGDNRLDIQMTPLVSGFSVRFINLLGGMTRVDCNYYYDEFPEHDRPLSAYPPGWLGEWESPFHSPGYISFAFIQGTGIDALCIRFVQFSIAPHEGSRYTYDYLAYTLTED